METEIVTNIVEAVSYVGYFERQVETYNKYNLPPIQLEAVLDEFYTADAIALEPQVEQFRDMAFGKEFSLIPNS